MNTTEDAVDAEASRPTSVRMSESEIDMKMPEAAKARVATVRLTFLPENRTVEFELEKLPYAEHGKERSLLDISLNFGIHLEHACGGNCACTTCHVWVKQGAELLSEMDDDEADKLDSAADLQLNSRLGCQAQIVRAGEIVVEIPAWNRNI
jgi:ferredoxin, 2Fe-2S